MFFSSLFFLVLHLFSTLKVDSSLIFSAFLSRKVCIWRCNWKNGWCWTKSREKWRKIIGLLTFVNKRAFSMISSSFWMVECDPFLCIITPQALESSKRSQDHRENSTHTQAPPTSASAAFSNDVLVKRKPLGPPLCLFFSLQKPIKAKELKKIIHEHKELAAVINAYSKTKLFSSFFREVHVGHKVIKKFPPFSPDFYSTNYVLSNLFCKW